MRVRYGQQEYEFAERMRVRALLEKLGILPETVVVVRNEEIVTEDEWLDVEDDVEVIRVVSGGRGR
jgi:thiamine biosynthesis protein ThiS